MARKNNANHGGGEPSGINNGGNNDANLHGVLDPSLDPLSPFYVHPGDGPSTVTVTPPLTSSNYQTWMRSMRRALITKNKFRLVDGSIQIPNEGDPNFYAWQRCNNLVHTWIMNSISPAIAQNLVYIDNVVDVWIELRERFSQVDLIRISELQSEIYSLKQGSFDSN